MNLKAPIIICASGNSVSEGIDKNLFSCLQNHYSIGLNYWFRFGYETTINTFCDSKFYIDNIEDLSKLGLIIGKDDTELTVRKKGIVQPNTILLPKSNIYCGINSFNIHSTICKQCNFNFEDRDPKIWPIRCPECKHRYVYNNGIYSGHLVGLFSLTLTIALGFENIYLLGYDCCEIDGKTHFYQDKLNLPQEQENKNFLGIGKQNNNYRTSTYNNVFNLNEERFSPYKKELNRISIKNVSLNSVLTVFPKISYEEFFNEIKDGNIDQKEARTEIHKYIIEKIK